MRIDGLENSTDPYRKELIIPFYKNPYFATRFQKFAAKAYHTDCFERNDATDICLQHHAQGRFT
ncbi:MAG TPA: hypothetical protein VGS79_25735 [Puia sp.]|nr:hypothetical protein [Puia sp.]